MLAACVSAALPYYYYFFFFFARQTRVLRGCNDGAPVGIAACRAAALPG
jgi:hypothetical protein